MEKDLEKIHFSFLLQNCSFVLQDKLLLKFFESNSILTKGDKFILNELFAFGNLHNDIFSFEFISFRSKTFNCTESHYINNTVKEIRKAMNCNKPLVFYFSNNMNNIINLMSTLAFFESQYFKKEIYVVLFDESNKEDIIISSIQLQGLQKIYEEVIVNKNFENLDKLNINKIFLNGIKLYQNYCSDNNEITEYIKKNSHMDIATLRKNIFLEFFKFGLNKLQIDSIVKKNI